MTIQTLTTNLRGTDGNSSVPVYASDAAGTGKSYTQGALTFILNYTYTGVTQPDISSVTGTWVRFIGTDGVPGDGSTANLYQITGTVGVNSVVDLIFTKSTYETANNKGIRIDGFSDGLTDTAGITDLEFIITTGANNQIFEASPRSRIILNAAASSSALLFFTSVASVLNDPTVGNALTITDPKTAGYYNLVATVIDNGLTVTLRLTSNTFGEWTSDTIVKGTLAGAGTDNNAYDSVTRTTDGNVDTAVPVVSITYAKGDIVYHPATSSEGYMQLADGSITTSDPADAAELPGTLSTWKQIT